MKLSYHSKEIELTEEQLRNSPQPYFTFKENLYTECDCSYGLNESFDIIVIDSAI